MHTLLQLLQDNPTLWLIAVTTLGLIVGSFLNVVIERLPKAMHKEWQQECRSMLDMDSALSPPITNPALAAIAWPGSHCPSCLTPP